MNVNKIYKGDAEEILKGFEDNIFDSHVSDPPYGLKFMGKHWDYDVPKVSVFKEMLRTLKPGGYILIACGTRTQHRMAVNIEDAGFEIRDVISWLYGSGFPKSLDIGKAIDKLQGNVREKVGEGFGTSYVHKDKINFEQGYRPNDYYEKNIGSFEVTKGKSEWEGYGTALKPAQEFWTLARKPLSEKTVAENVLKHGTGGINIDGCRIEHDEEQKFANRNGRSNASVLTDESCGFDNTKNNIASASPLGRFPSNVILDEFMGKELDKQSGITSSSDAVRKNKQCDTMMLYGDYNSCETTGFNDEGGASRYFKSIKSGGNEDFFTYICLIINKEICGSTLENQKVVGMLNGVMKEIEKYFQSDYRFMFGNKKTESCQKDMKYTIEILTKQMMLLKTCNALQGMNIDFYTQGLMKIINSLMDANIEDVKNAESIRNLKSFLIEMLEHIKVIVNPVQTNRFLNGDKEIEQNIMNTTENIGQRFIYTPKADNYQRNKGLKGFGEKFESMRPLSTTEGSDRNDMTTRLNSKAGKNFHPTVKPIDLMRYLVKLITPKGGLTCDAFCGSGTTLIGAKLELINYVGIEREKDYVEISEARVAAWNPERYKDQELF